jgi:hypothetical protein
VAVKLEKIIFQLSAVSSGVKVRDHREGKEPVVLRQTESYTSLTRYIAPIMQQDLLGLLNRVY